MKNNKNDDERENRYEKTENMNEEKEMF